MACLFCPVSPAMGIILLALVLQFGCYPQYDQLNDPEFRLARQELAESFSRRARQMESRQELGKALLDWQIAEALNPDSDLAHSRAEALRRQVQEKAQSAYRAGRAALEQGAWNKAAEAFVRALSYDSESQKALQVLRSLWRRQDFVVYELKNGDKAASIAEKLYKDPEKAELVAHFLDTGPKKNVAEGKSRILLPRIPPPSDQGGLAQQVTPVSRDAENKGNVKASSDKAEYSSPADTKTIYQKGRTLIEQKRLQEALRAFQSIDPDYQDTRDWIASLKQRLQEKSEAHYRKGLIHFLAENLDKAIQEWETALSLAPDHEASRRGLEKARQLRENLKNYN